MKIGTMVVAGEAFGKVGSCICTFLLNLFRDFCSRSNIVLYSLTDDS